MNLRLALLNKALGINDQNVHGLARAYAESKGLAKEVEALKEGEDEKNETRANFDSPEFDPKRINLLERKTILDHAKGEDKEKRFYLHEVNLQSQLSDTIKTPTGGASIGKPSRPVRSILAKLVSEINAELLENGVLFSTPELDPKSTGITKRDIETQARGLGRVPFRPKPKTWPEVYQRSEAMLNQTGFIEKLVEDVAKYVRPLTAEQTIAVGQHQLALANQYAEIRGLRLQTEDDLEKATGGDVEYVNGLNEALKEIKGEEAKIASRYSICYKAFRMSKAEQGRALAANRAEFSEEFNSDGWDSRYRSAASLSTTGSLLH